MLQMEETPATPAKMKRGMTIDRVLLIPEPGGIARVGFSHRESTSPETRFTFLPVNR